MIGKTNRYMPQFILKSRFQGCFMLTVFWVTLVILTTVPSKKRAAMASVS